MSDLYMASNSDHDTYELRNMSHFLTPCSAMPKGISISLYVQNMCLSCASMLFANPYSCHHNRIRSAKCNIYSEQQSRTLLPSLITILSTIKIKRRFIRVRMRETQCSTKRPSTKLLSIQADFVFIQQQFIYIWFMLQSNYVITISVKTVLQYCSTVVLQYLAYPG